MSETKPKTRGANQKKQDGGGDHYFFAADDDAGFPHPCRFLV